MIDGVYEAEAEEVRFHEVVGLDEAAIGRVQERVRRRVLKAFVRWGLLEPEVRDEMLEWRHGGGFSLDAAVRLEADDREGLERLLRYCARPPLAAGHLQWRVLRCAPKDKIRCKIPGMKAPCQDEIPGSVPGAPL